ncbi:hypothetical protein ACH5RR_020659 [Cinchona calisaya]|uniref:Uncharacterized protein n=1 Tax=Cinchona calisaya TaxID=153742 RepID=A0ABD2ZIK9_9GENT
MNPLTLVKRIQNINAKEAALGISDEASWHAKYKDSAYVYAGGISFDLTEGDLISVFAQYGEIVDINLVRDKGTGKSKGFAFIAYEDQRSTILAVDNLNGAQILGRTIRVDHVTNYKKKEEEDEETEQRKREERGICRAFQRGECNRGAGCKFSHDERRAANTGWGHEEDRHSRWANDKFEGSIRTGKQSGASGRIPESGNQEGHGFMDKDSRGSRSKINNMGSERHYEHDELGSRDVGNRDHEKRLERKEKDMRHRDDRDDLHDRGSRRRDDSREDRDLRDEKRSRRYESESYNREDRNSRGKDEKRSRKYESDSYSREDKDSRVKDKSLARDRDSPPSHLRNSDEDHRHRSHR